MNDDVRQVPLDKIDDPYIAMRSNIEGPEIEDLKTSMRDQGLIEPIVRKYPMLSFEDAYWLAKKDTLNEEADRRARGIVSGKKGAVLEKPGSGAGVKSQKVNAKNREEAMNMVAEAIRAGRPVPEFDEIGDS